VSKSATKRRLNRQRLKQRDLKNAPFWTVLLIEGIAVAYVGFSPEHWLRAVGVMALGLMIAGVARLLLSEAQAGLLRVRKRAFDVACYLSFGVLVITFGLTLPQR
jgi:hypothetical protein